MSSSTLPRIVLLAPELCNQIAAGEVVERPASVVKELVENSLDALSTRIDVCLENGGQGLIRVQDNGVGMLREDLELALTRHATSKIRAVTDLENIHSYGFRGEALPSVASVSRCTLTSIGAGEDEAWSMHVEFGKTVAVQPASLHRGTIVEIRDLFANTPARLKFLRGMPTEVKHCQEWLARLALARPDVAFRLESGGRELLNFLHGETVFERLEQIWPRLVTENLVPFDRSLMGMRVHGYTSQPQVSQPRGNRILLFVNGRSVSDKKIFAAIREAYKGKITSRDHPQVVLFLEMDPADVDVNVHPAKSEVRFRDESAVFRAILVTLQSALEAAGQNRAPVTDGTDGLSAGATQAGMGAKTVSERSQTAQAFARLYEEGSRNGQDLPTGQAAKPMGFWGRADAPLMPSMPLGKGRETESGDIEWHISEAKEQAPAREEPAPAEAFADWNPAGYEGTRTGGAADTAACVVSEGIEKTEAVQQGLPARGLFPDNAKSYAPAGALTTEPARRPPTSFPEASGVKTASSAESQVRLAGMTYLGQVARTYLVLRDAAGALLLLDQHAAHERVLYARMSTKGLQGQGLAVPLELVLHPTEAQRWLETRDMLASLGFSGSLQGARLVISAIPVLLERPSAQEFLREVLAGSRDDFNTRFASMSCKSAIKAGQELTQDEALSLIQQWLQVPDKEYCPHGRPAVLRWDGADLERLFKRRQS